MMQNQHIVKAKIVMLIICLCIVIVTYNSSAQDLTFEPLFTAQGVDKREILDMQGNARKLDPMFFEISKDADGNWQYNCRAYFSDDDMTSWNHSSCDGTNVYTSVHATKVRMLDGSFKPIHNVFGGASHSVSIRRSTPSDETGGTAWLAFFGGDYLTKHPEAKIPLYIDRYSPINWAYDFEFEWHENAKSPLLKRGKFILNPDLLYDDLIHYPEVSEPSEEMLQRIIYDIKWHRKFAKHAQKTNPELLSLASFEVEEIISGANFSFPKKATWEFHSINYTNAKLRYFSGSGGLEITNYIIHPRGKRVALLPKLTGTNVGFQDFRYMFRDEDKCLDFRMYELSDGIWPISTNDPRIAKSGRVFFQPRTQLAKRNFIYYFNVILVIILVSLPFVIWFQKRQPQK